MDGMNNSAQSTPMAGMSASAPSGMMDNMMMMMDNMMSMMNNMMQMDIMGMPGM